MARDFVRGCLNKIPKLRPTYSMLLQHGWLAPLSKPPAISEDEETADTTTTADAEVAEWVVAAMERRRTGRMGGSAKPALHAVSLDSVSPMPSPAETPVVVDAAAG